MGLLHLIGRNNLDAPWPNVRPGKKASGNMQLQSLLLPLDDAFISFFYMRKGDPNAMGEGESVKPARDAGDTKRVSVLRMRFRLWVTRHQSEKVHPVR